MLCPNCKTALSLAERQGVEIDYCPQCRGVWLDRGELDRIIERNERELSAAPPRGDQRDSYSDQRERYGEQRGYKESHGHYSGKHYRKKSLLGELFDF